MTDRAALLMRKAARTRCPACRLGGFRQTEAPDGRPQFTCTRCNHSWTDGRDGGIYALALRALASELS